MNALTPARMEIIRNALVSAAEEMSETIIRTAYNPLLYDIKDFGVTILSARGDMWAQASGLAVFLGSLRGTIRTSLERYSPSDYREGDVFIANCPYLTGTHLSDTAVYMPIFVDGQLIAFAATMAHWADIGGRSSGGWDPSSTDVYMEGMRFTHQRLHEGGRPNESLYEFIRSNVRLPRVVTGDLDAQIAACRTAVDRVTWLCEKYGTDAVEQSMEHVIDNTRRALKKAVGALPDGRWDATQRLDFDGVDRDYEPIVGVSVEIAGERITVDLGGSSSQAPGPINCPEIGARSVVLAALKGVFSPHEPTNEGHMSFVDFRAVDAPSLVNAAEPAPCDSYGIVCRTLVETTVRVMAHPSPEQSRAGGYQMVSCHVMKTNAEESERFTYTEPLPGGYGAFPGSDGSTLVFGGDTPLLPVEVLESRYPLRCETLALDTDSAGRGRYRGGYGIKRDIRVLADGCTVKSSFESISDPLSKGVNGGSDGQPARLELTRPDGSREVVRERPQDFRVSTGTVIGVRTGGGGGYGSPTQRDPRKVLDDVMDDLITPEDANCFYSVVLARDATAWSLDEPATTTRRAEQHPVSQTSNHNHTNKEKA